MTSPMPTAKRPRCEYRVDPLGIDERSPRLSRALESESSGDRQSAYRVLVACSEENLGAEANVLWDGGGGEPYRSVGVEDGGKLLRSGSRFTWMGPLLGGSGNPTPCSVSAVFRTGLPESSERKGARVCAGEGPGLSGPGALRVRGQEVMRG
jgi:alpha-L-rhamnosidase